MSESRIIYTREVSTKWDIAKKWIVRGLIVTGVILALYLIYFLFDSGIINIGITKSENGEESLIFTLLNSLIMGMYVTCLGWSVGASKWYIKLLLIGIVGLFLYLGFTNVGLKVCSNLPIFLVSCYESNSAQGIVFFLGNLLFFTALFGLTFITEGEKQNE